LLRIGPQTEITSFARKVEELCGEDAFKCIQCGKCSAGCPITPFMDLLPHQVMKLIQLSSEEKVLSSSTIWICASCETCTTRCPESIDIAKVMDTLRKLCLERGMKPKEKEVYAFCTAFLNSVKKHGRLFEAGFMMEFNAATGKALKEMGESISLGFHLWRRGKLGFLPSYVSEKGPIRKVFETAKRFMK